MKATAADCDRPTLSSSYRFLIGTITLLNAVFLDVCFGGKPQPTVNSKINDKAVVSRRRNNGIEFVLSLVNIARMTYTLPEVTT